MKLFKRESIGKKDGKTYTSYKVGKLNEHGDGLMVNQKVEFKFVFDPRIKRNIPYTDPKTKVSKVFDAVDAVVEWVNIPEECKSYLNDFGNLTVNLPTRFVDILDQPGWKGQSCVIYLKSFTDKEGKEKSTWVLESAHLDSTTTHNDNGTQTQPDTKSFDPKVEDIIRQCVEQRDDFIKDLVGLTAVHGVDMPLEFMNWFKTNSGLDTSADEMKRAYDEIINRMGYAKPAK